MNRLWLASIGAILIYLLSAGAAMAQSETELVPFCGSLSVDECADVDASSEMMAELTSGTSENEVKFYATGAALGNQELSLVLSSDRTFVIAQETLDRLMTLKAMPPAEFAADPAAITEAMVLPYSIDFDQTVSIALSPELIAHLSELLSVNIPSTFSVHARMVNGVVYIRLADFDVLGKQPEWVPEWVGIQTRAIVSDTVTRQVAEGTVDAAQVQASLTPPGAALEGSIIYQIPADQASAYADFTTLNALGTVDQDGKPIQLYYMSWDLPRYFGGPLFAEQTEQPYPSPASYLYGSLSTILLDGLAASMTQGVGLSDSLVYSVDTTATWALGIPGGPPIAERPTLGLSKTMHNSDLNSVSQINPPEGAFVPPINVIMAFIDMAKE